MGKQRLPNVPSKEEIVRLFEIVYLPKLAIALFVSTMCGLRVQEIRTLKINNINLQRREIKITNSKNPNRSKEGYGKDRYVPIPECAISPIKKWLSIIEEHTEWFLPSEKSIGMSVSTEWLHRMFDEARRNAGLTNIEREIKYKKKTKDGVDKRTQYFIKWHSMRHFYATYVYEKTGDILLVSKLLGHNQIDTTQIYAQVSDRRKREGVNFAFDIALKTRNFIENPQAVQFNDIATIAKPRVEGTPLSVLNRKLADGDISDIEYQHKVKLLKLAKDHLENNLEQKNIEVPEQRRDPKII